MLTFREAEHTYAWNGKPVPNVSSIIEGAYDFRFVNEDALERARVLGKKVHKVTELHDLRRLDEAKLHDTLKKYLVQWIQFREDHNVEIVKCEQQGYCEKWGFAGTIDRIVTINGELFVLDIKTGLVYVPHYLQSAGYKIIAQENGWCEKNTRRCSVYLYEDGYEIRFHTDPMDEPVFLAQLTVKRYMDKHNVKR
jgi:hypothetical protein